MADGFLGRWSRRKLDVKEGRAVEAEREVAPPPQPSPGGGGSNPPVDAASFPPGADGAASFPPPPGEGQGQGGGAPPAAGAAGARAREATPTLEDTHSLTLESDFTRFVRADVPPEVRNAAVKKLFADPHFNVMDGLDTYIDDYGKPDPLPESVIRQLASVQFLGLFREEEAAEEAARATRDDAEGGEPATVAQSPESAAAEESPEPPPLAGPDHGHADLRLQPDDAAGPPEPGPGTGRETGAA